MRHMSHVVYNVHLEENGIEEERKNRMLMCILNKYVHLTSKTRHGGAVY